MPQSLFSLWPTTRTFSPTDGAVLSVVYLLCLYSDYCLRELTRRRKESEPMVGCLYCITAVVRQDISVVEVRMDGDANVLVTQMQKHCDQPGMNSLLRRASSDTLSSSRS